MSWKREKAVGLNARLTHPSDPTFQHFRFTQATLWLQPVLNAVADAFEGDGEIAWSARFEHDTWLITMNPVEDLGDGCVDLIRALQTFTGIDTPDGLYTGVRSEEHGPPHTMWTAFNGVVAHGVIDRRQVVLTLFRDPIDAKRRTGG